MEVPPDLLELRHVRVTELEIFVVVTVGEGEDRVACVVLILEVADEVCVGR